MKPNLNTTDVHRFAAIELNLFHRAHAIPGLNLEGALVNPGTPIHDPTGVVLFYRVALDSPHGERLGYADIAAHTLFGSPLLATAPDALWDADAWIAEAQTAFEHQRYECKWPDYDEARFVAFSFPKLAVQFLRGGKEIVMLELGTWAIVPPAGRSDRKKMEPGSFERWSLIQELPAGQKKKAHARFEARARALAQPELRAVSDVNFIATTNVAVGVAVATLRLTRELHYSTRSADHHACYELRGQETNVWCVAASVQMVLDFYRYEYPQTRIAQALDLGTLANPSGLPYANDNDVAVQLHALSSGALSANMLTTPPFSTYVAQINANRPMVSFIPGHSRTVAGYTESLLVVLGGGGYHGLLVYDPWPPNAGVITKWENFDTQTYRRAFTAHVTTV